MGFNSGFKGLRRTPTLHGVRRFSTAYTSLPLQPTLSQMNPQPRIIFPSNINYHLYLRLMRLLQGGKVAPQSKGSVCVFVSRVVKATTIVNETYHARTILSSILPSRLAPHADQVIGNH